MGSFGNHIILTFPSITFICCLGFVGVIVILSIIHFSNLRISEGMAKLLNFQFISLPFFQSPII